MSNCRHEDFVSHSRAIRVEESEPGSSTVRYRVELDVMCQECKMPFVFVGLKPGYNVNGPTTDVDGVELRIPIKPFEI